MALLGLLEARGAVFVHHREAVGLGKVLHQRLPGVAQRADHPNVPGLYLVVGLHRADLQQGTVQRRSVIQLREVRQRGGTAGAG